MNIYNLLEKEGIGYLKVDHPPVFTCEQARKLVPPLSGAETKNLFLRDKKGKNHLLLVAGADKIINLKKLSKQLGQTNLSLASPARLQKYLGITPGAVSILSLVNDSNHNVSLLIDQDLAASERIKCHPLDNSATLSIKFADIQRLLAVTGHSPLMISLNE